MISLSEQRNKKEETHITYCVYDVNHVNIAEPFLYVIVSDVRCQLTWLYKTDGNVSRRRTDENSSQSEPRNGLQLQWRIGTNNTGSRSSSRHTLINSASVRWCPRRYQCRACWIFPGPSPQQIKFQQLEVLSYIFSYSRTRYLRGLL